MRFACADLLSACGDEGVIVVPSPLTAAVARQQFTADQLRRGFHSWQRRSVYSVDAWLAALWNEARYQLTDVPTLLSAAQEYTLWQQIIEQSNANLFDIGSTARLAMGAAKLTAEWNIREHRSWSDYHDTEHFRAWHDLFRRTCRQQNWIAHADLWNVVPEWISAGVGGQAHIVFAGFPAFNPALEQLIQLLGTRAVLPNAPSSTVGQRAAARSCIDFALEIEQAARWSRAVFEEQPDASIGIFVPDLATHRSLVERTFQQVYYPSAALELIRSTGQSEVDSVFHIHAAAPMRTHPLVVSGLLLLQLARPHFDVSVASAILRSPFLPGANEERSKRAFSDIELRKKRELDMRFEDLEFATRNCPTLVPLWRRMRYVLRRMPRRQELSSWSEFFADILQALDWPGDSGLTAQEEDTLDMWNDALSRLAALGLVTGQVSYEYALTCLRNLLSRPAIERGDWFSPIQILDASDASGLEFDRAFVIGLSDQTWPPPTNTNPFVPLQLQRASQVPGSSPRSAQQEQERITRALFRSAPVVTATYSGRLSPLAEGLAKPERMELPEWQGKLPRQSYVPILLDQIEDANAPAYIQDEDTRGGASVIRAQSVCPFRAFAEFRLRATTPEDGCFGFDSRDRGGFMHEALQKVWERLKTQDRLLAISDEELRLIVREAVEQAVKDGDPGPFDMLLSHTERDRLEQLISDWLDVERARTQPFTVETLEQQRFYDFPGLRLRLRVDRLDRLHNGKLLLIDYKSGAQSRGKLKSPRPEEPQLLVYATAIGNEVDGVFFGELTPRQPRAVGFSREKYFQGQAAEVREDWDVFLAQSQEEVRRLAAEFVSGHAAVHPLKGACGYCDITPLCRVKEAVPEGEEE
jgi:ATP-dependent helicase/nuclease subunit B